MAGRPDVDKMLSEIPASHITEWRAYEEENGRLDRTWDQQVMSLIDTRLQQLIQVTLMANSDKGKTKYKVDPVSLPWESKKDIEAKKKAPVRSGPKHEKSKQDFYKTLAERNRRRGITQKSVAESKAKSNRDPSKKAGERWR